MHSGELEPFEILKLDGTGFDRVACLPVVPVTVTGLAKDGSWIDPVNERALIDTGADIPTLRSLLLTTLILRSQKRHGTETAPSGGAFRPTG